MPRKRPQGAHHSQQHQQQESPYKVLGISPAASADEIRAAWKKMALKTHPDKLADDGEAKAFKAVQAAYETLRNTVPRPARGSAQAAGKPTRWGGTKHENEEKTYNPINAADRAARHEQYMERMRQWAQEEKLRREQYERERPASWADKQAQAHEARYRARLEKIRQQRKQQEESKRMAEEECERMANEAAARQPAPQPSYRQNAPPTPAPRRRPVEQSARQRRPAYAPAPPMTPPKPHQEPQARPHVQHPGQPRAQHARQPRAAQASIDPAPLPRPGTAAAAAAATGGGAGRRGGGISSDERPEVIEESATGEAPYVSVPRAVQVARSRAGTSTLEALFRQLDESAGRVAQEKAFSSMSDENTDTVTEEGVCEATAAPKDGGEACYYSTRWHRYYHSDATCKWLVGVREASLREALGLTKPITETIGIPNGLAPCSQCVGLSDSLIEAEEPAESNNAQEQEQRPKTKWTFEPCPVEPSCAQELQADLCELQRTWNPETGGVGENEAKGEMPVASSSISPTNSTTMNTDRSSLSWSSSLTLEA